MVASSSEFFVIKGASTYAFKLLAKQILATVFGIGIALIVAKIDYNFWRKPVVIVGLFLLTCLLLGYALIHPPIHGTHRWIKIGPLTLQPSHIAKYVTVIVFANWFEDINRTKNFMHGIAPALLSLGIIGILIGLEPSIGMLFIILSVSILMLFAAGVRLSQIGFITSSLGGVILFLINKVPYATKRFMGFINNGHEQVTQSILGIGSGGIFGKGLGEGFTKKFFLPLPHTDFIFSTIAEEWGLVGSIGILFAFFVILWRGISIALNSKDRFSMLCAFGITLTIFIQAMLHIGVACGVCPPTGIPLPFISAGGSGLVTNFFALGILLSISKKAQNGINTSPGTEWSLRNEK